MHVTDATRNFLAEKGFDPKMGARPLRRLIQDEIEDQLSEKLLRGEFGAGDSVELDIDSGGSVVVQAPKKKATKARKQKVVASESNDSDSDDKEPVATS
jgi:ATP-dependent Clp protease ATP-binding subunit ClpC